MFRITSVALASYFTLIVSTPCGLAADPDFEKAIAPILLTHCVECHSGTSPAGGLNLTHARGLLAGGDNGPAINPTKPLSSHLLERITAGEMPPAVQGKPRPLAAADAKRMQAWVAAGAPWPKDRTLDPFESTTQVRAGRDWWSLQPIQHAAPPAVKGKERVANPIDAFVLSKLEPRGWSLAPRADKRTLIRRLYFDLLGLPPSFEETEAFAQDNSVHAYRDLVDRLLKSPHYGERWGRYWLDIARYAETCGYERDQVKTHIWKYRDYVIQAFNDDKPYDRFIIEQLAGDEIPDRTINSVIATGFLRLGTWNDEPNDPNEYKYDRLEDLVHATSTAFLGMTVKCARCHDHKFDPIRQTDYYRMGAAFWAGPIEPGPRELLGGPDSKMLGYDVHGWTDRGREVPSLKLLKKGDPNRPQEMIAAAPLSMIPSLDQAFQPPPAGSKTTQRRLQLAQWIANPRNPLTARVWVNRIWQFHFGQGLVRTPDNFGFNGDKPSHPELLDWLASEFMSNGWRAKPIHRLVLLSETYQQRSVHPQQDLYADKDALNRLVWRAERRRLDAEGLWDALLRAGGNLRSEPIGGPSFAPVIPADALEGLSMKGAAWKPSPPAEQNRRGMYIFSKRGLLTPLLTTFDFPDTTLPNCRRDVTTVAPQALALLNNPLVHQQSEALARRVFTQAESTEQRIRRAWQLALGRDPRETELMAAKAHMQEQTERFAGKTDRDLLALTSLCHVLLNTNEFLYVD